MRKTNLAIGLVMVIGVLSGLFSTVAADDAISNTENMLLWYTFNETDGDIVHDMSGKEHHAEIMNGESWGEGRTDGAVSLTGENYINLPGGIMKDLNDFTITAWVNQSSVVAWQRLLDVGNGITQYVYLTLSDGAGSRFSINNNNSWHEFSAANINDPGVWHFIAVTKTGSHAEFYIDGVLSSSSDTIEHNPSDIGATNQNYIGKSQYDADRNFMGLIDDFRIYTVGMNGIDIQNLMSETLTDEQVLELNRKTLDIGDTFAVEEDLVLAAEGSNGVSITWTSNDPAHLSATGEITKPAEGEGDAVVELTATLTKNDATLSQIFEVTILEEGATPYGIFIDADKTGTDISPTLYGIFFEDINYALDGGLYPELVQNRSFEFQNVDTKESDKQYAWWKVELDGGSGAIMISDDDPLNENNPNYLKLEVVKPGGGVGIWNTGFPNQNTLGEPGMSVKEGAFYTFSMFARSTDYDGTLEITIEGADGTVYADRELDGITEDWQKLSCLMVPDTSDEAARLVVKMNGTGTVDMDMISLFPKKTWKYRKNGVRRDLGEMLEALQPSFVRFPGGCIAEGENVENIYRWKDTVGKLEERKMNYDLWYSAAYPYYHQSYGIGFYEYFQMCEDLNAQAVPVVNAGLTCQARTPIIIPMEELEPFIEDALDLIEFANGDPSTVWGKLRADMGHPEPFNLQYLAVGNENWSQVYFERYEAFAEVIRAEYPDIQLITTSGPQAEDDLFMEARAWMQSGRADADLVDEHYYRDPSWFYTNINRYDNYDRNLPKVFVGEYASRGNTMRNALAEAAFMTALEENSDIVAMASYAPLFAKENFIQWTPDLIWFDNTQAYGSVNYYVQQMFMTNVGDVTLPSEIIRHGESTYAIKGRFGLGSYSTSVVYDDVVVTDNTTGDELFNNDFTEDASDWTPAAGTWEVIDGEYAQTNAAAPNTLAYAGSEDITNYSVSLRAKKTEGGEGFLIYVGLKDERNYLRWNLGGYGNTRGSFESVKNGVVSTISEFDLTTFCTIETGVWYDIGVTVSGNTIKCYLNGELAFDLVHTPKYGPLYTTTSKNSDEGEIIVKVVNPSAKAWDTKINLKNAGSLHSIGTKIVLRADDPSATNTLDDPEYVAPVTSRITNVSESFIETFEPYSVTILKLKTKSERSGSRWWRRIKREHRD